MRFEASDICYDGGMVSPPWRLPVSEIRVIAEYTDPSGLGLDDYLLLVLKSPTEVYVAPMYADGLDKVMRLLAQELRCDLAPSLVGTTSFASRVLWPECLLGKPLYVVIAPPPAQGLTGKLVRIKEALLGVEHYNLTDEVLRYLSGASKGDTTHL